MRKDHEIAQQGGGRSMGLQILAWTMVVIGLILVVWGFFEFPKSEWWELDFLSWALSGMTLVAGGLAILKSPAGLIIAAIIIATLLLAVFIWNAQMGIANTLISYVVTIALVSWLISLVLK